MASYFGKSLLGVAAFFVATGSLVAQVDEAAQEFQKGFEQVMLGNKDPALVHFRQVVKLTKSNAQAFELIQRIEKDKYNEMQLQEGEVGRILKSLAEMAKPGRQEVSRDAEAIAALADQACSDDYGQRAEAIGILTVKHGEFSVPAFLDKLGNVDDNEGQTRAIMALHGIGRPCTLPLTQALHSDNPTLRRNAAAALNLIRDRRAAPALARLQEDDQESIREVATNALKRLGISQSNAVDLYLKEASTYLRGTGSLGRDFSSVVWHWAGDGLAYSDIPASIYGTELAMQNSVEALSLDPASEQAQTLVARSHLAKAASIEAALASKSDDEAMNSLEATVPQLRMVSMSMGPRVLRQALLDSLADRQSLLAVAAIRALGEAEDKDGLSSSPLLQALDNDNKQIAYEAALAISKAARGSNLPAAAKVVAKLGEAVTEESVLRVAVIDKNPQGLSSAKEAGANSRGVFVNAGTRPSDIIPGLLSNGGVDVIIMNETLDSEYLTESYIGVLRDEEHRTSGAKILVIANDLEKAQERFGDQVDGFIQGPLQGEAMMAEVERVLEGVSMDARNARADKVAVEASLALSSLASSGVQVGRVEESLVKQLNRGDDIAIPAAQALGEGGSMAGSLPALVQSIVAGDSLNLKVAAAQAAGLIMARSNDNPFAVENDTSFDSLIALVKDEGTENELRQAVITALGKAKLSPGQHLQLVKTLSGMIVATDAGSDA